MTTSLDTPDTLKNETIFLDVTASLKKATTSLDTPDTLKMNKITKDVPNKKKRSKKKNLLGHELKVNLNSIAKTEKKEKRTPFWDHENDST